MGLGLAILGIEGTRPAEVLTEACLFNTSFKNLAYLEPVYHY